MRWAWIVLLAGCASWPYRYDARDAAGGVALSADGRYLAFSTRVWDLKENRIVFELHEPALSFAFSPDGSLVAAGTRHERIRTWEIPGGEVRYVFQHHAPVHTVAFDGARLVAGSSNGSILVADATTGEVLRTLNGMPMSCMAVKLDAIVSGSGMMWGDDVKRVHSVPDVTSIAFLPSGEIAMGARSDAFIRAGDRKIGEHEIGDKVLAVGGSRLASRISAAKIRVWDASTWTALYTLDSPDTISLALSSDGKRLAAATRDGRVSVWDEDRVLATYRGY